MSCDRIAATLDRFLTESAPLPAGEPLVVAFSGGPDSTALLAGLVNLRQRRSISLVAAHFDHGLDDHSRDRAAAAARIASALDVPFVTERATPAETTTVPRGLEDWARRVRYAFLERTRESRSARYVATAHHRDDQIETVLLRILLGSGLEGLGGVSPIRGCLIRPLLTLSRRELAASVNSHGLQPVIDRSNEDTDRPRNFVRHHLLPHLLAADAGIEERLLRLGAAGRATSEGLVERLTSDLDPQPVNGGASIRIDALGSLPRSLWSFALSLLHRTAGLAYPAPAGAQRELRQQLERGAGIGCDCGDSWYWHGGEGRLTLQRRETPPRGFTYTLRVPGELEIPELGVRVSVRREKMAPWMLEGRPTRAALDLPLTSGETLVVRNRRPGDRIQPLGCRYSRRLKEVLIDRRIPRAERDRLPLLCIGERIAWVPGVTVDEAYRLSPDSRPWVAHIDPA